MMWRLSWPIAATLLILWVQPAAGAGIQSWERDITAVVQKNRSYPRSAELRGDEGTAKVRVSIAADGKITNVDVIQSSGHQILDHEAVRLFKRIGSFSPPPGGSAVDVVFPLTWQLDR